MVKILENIAQLYYNCLPVTVFLFQFFEMGWDDTTIFKLLAGVKKTGRINRPLSTFDNYP